MANNASSSTLQKPSEQKHSRPPINPQADKHNVQDSFKMKLNELKMQTAQMMHKTESKPTDRTENEAVPMDIDQVNENKTHIPQVQIFKSHPSAAFSRQP